MDHAPAPLLPGISSPADLRRLDRAELARLAEEIRSLILDVVGKNGGHLASNLGVVELTLALHRVFDLSRDPIFFDVGHQCYAHKIVTGRAAAFSTLRRKGGVSGFPNPAESPFDPFMVGHASTAISCAAGMAEAFRGQSPRRQAIAVVGDASIVGGMSFEALNHAGQTKADVLVILNDNDMAIAATSGAFSAYLTDIRTRPTTRSARLRINRALEKTPLVGGALARLQEYILSGVKGLAEANHVFSALGFRCFGPLDGHDLPLLELELARIGAIEGPRLLHVVTTKGRGYAAAAGDPETYHSTAPFEVKGRETRAIAREDDTYTGTFAAALKNMAEKDPDIVAVTAAMPAGTGIREFGKAFPRRFHDVGICEAHAVAFSAALAKGGKKPVVAIYSTFLQRGYDQTIHDLAIQPSLPVVFAIDRAGLVGADGPTHHGIFDIAFLRHVPGLTVMAPRDGRELAAMLELALSLGSPSAIRYPRGSIPEADPGCVASGWPAAREKLEVGRAEVLRSGKDGAVIAYGRMVWPAWRAVALAAERGRDLTLVNARFVKPLDVPRLLTTAKSHPWLATVEDHVLAGGFGSAVLEALADHGVSTPVRRIGVPDRFPLHASPAELDSEFGLSPEALADVFMGMPSKELA